MGNRIEIDGNLGQDPSLDTPEVGGETRQVCNLRIYAPNWRLDKESGEYSEQGGFWITGSVWGPQAEACHRLLKKGNRVRVVGRLREDQWTDRESGDEVSALRLVIDEVSLPVGRVDSVAFQARRHAPDGAPTR